MQESATSLDSAATPDAPCPVAAFINRWNRSGGAELANAQSFLTELCALLDVLPPDPSVEDIARNAYVFERTVFFPRPDGTASTGRIDCYKRGCFVLETKQGVTRKDEEAAAAWSTPGKKKVGHGLRSAPGWDKVMLRAKNQAEGYVRALPAGEGRPPFLLVVDVGNVIEIFAEFSRTGGVYTPFPDPRSHKIKLEDLHDEAVRQRLQRIWTDPMSLDPSRVSTRVTRDIADHLAVLAKRLEAQGHEAQAVARFLMRCLFTMFAEDVGLLDAHAFSTLLDRMRATPQGFAPTLEELWAKMNTGGYSVVLQQQIRHFNGGLFADCQALALDPESIDLLLAAARHDWRDVEPAIFGTLLERALNPKDRHKLGAHFTPRAYVERLVLPTVMEPLRREWADVQAAVALHMAQVEQGKKGAMGNALAEVRAFHKRLCTIRVLDPACGTGNFLYVALEHMKRLEGEVLDLIANLGGSYRLEGRTLTVDPHQFLGLEVNPRAAAIAELVLWIGYLQWHFRTYGSHPADPIIKNFRNIEHRDALLTWNAVEAVLDEHGQPVTRWDGETKKTHPVTGQEVPDESARVPELRYVNPREARWPEAEFIVGNPPFIGGSWKRSVLGGGVFDALAAVYPGTESIDFVMYWWDKAARLLQAGTTRRFGFITTNSLRQVFNRRVLQRYLDDAKKPVSLVFAVPDHPWVDEADGAAVRISMTVAQAGAGEGTLATVVEEGGTTDQAVSVTLATRAGRIWPDLTIGADVAGAKPLRAMEGISCPGVKLHGAGFIVSPERARELGLGSVPGLERHIRPYLNGRDLQQQSRNVMVIDLFGLSAEEVRDRFPAVYQHVLERVKPERDVNPRESRRKRWWIFGEPISTFRPALAGLPRYIATVETAKHRVFVFLDGSILPDNKLINIASDDAYVLGVLSSRVHVVWALAAGGWLGVGNDPVYAKTRCFETFPFPDATAEQRTRIQGLGERLDAHRKARQAAHPELTLTGMYNILEKLRAGETLTPKERTLHEQGLVTVLRELHDELDAAVAQAYGWDAALHDAAILEQLADLNAQRLAEEARGQIRWLRPEYQDPALRTRHGVLPDGSRPDHLQSESTAEAAPAGPISPLTPTAQPDPIAEQITLVPTPATAPASPDSQTELAVPASLLGGKRPWPKSLPDRVKAVRDLLADSPPPPPPGNRPHHLHPRQSSRSPQRAPSVCGNGKCQGSCGGCV